MWKKGQDSGTSMIVKAILILCFNCLCSCFNKYNLKNINEKKRIYAINDVVIDLSSLSIFDWWRLLDTKDF